MLAICNVKPCVGNTGPAFVVFVAVAVKKVLSMMMRRSLYEVKYSQLFCIGPGIGIGIVGIF